MKEYKPGEAYGETVRTCTTFVKSEKKILEAFVAEVNRTAEEIMIKTGKLEGSHHAAIKIVMGRYP